MVGLWVCSCLITGVLVVSDVPGAPPIIVAPHGESPGGLTSTRGCASGVFYYEARKLIIEVRKPRSYRIKIRIPPIWGTADFQYCFGTRSARIGTALVAVDIDEK